MRRGLVTGALLALLTTGMARSAPPAHPDPAAGRWAELTKGLAEPATTSYGGGGFAQLLSMLGRDDLAAQIPIPPVRARQECKPLLEDGKPPDPVAYIARRAAEVRVTMINEAHDEPLTRAFIARVAAALRDKGYEGFAAETFTPQIGVTAPAWPLYMDGYYSREPVYGRLIRQLRQEKYRLLSYEFSPLNDPKVPFTEQMNQRMAGQAANLITQMAREGEDAKILVHAGYANLSERPTVEGGTTHMGYEFARVAGIDPLTVDQTVLQAPGADFMVCDPSQIEQRRAYADIMIGVPKVQFERGRPTYRLALGDRFAEIPARLRRNEIAVYDARPVGEPLNSVPMDRIVLRAGESLPLLLPPGRYNVTVWTEKLGWSSGIPLTVPGRTAGKAPRN